MAAPPQHVEEAWQSAEFFVNKVRMPETHKADIAYHLV